MQSCYAITSLFSVRLEGCILCQGAQIKAKANLKDCEVSSGQVVAPGSRQERGACNYLLDSITPTHYSTLSSGGEKRQHLSIKLVRRLSPTFPHLRTLKLAHYNAPLDSLHFIHSAIRAGFSTSAFQARKKRATVAPSTTRWSALKLTVTKSSVITS